MKLLLIAALMLPLTAVAASGDRDRLAMGPDPGGHTGATVTPETTRADREEVDKARKAASGTRTETNDPESEQSEPRDDKQQ